MKRESILKLLTVFVMVALVIGIAKSSFAVSTITAIENSSGNGTNNTLNNIARNEPVNNTPVNNTPVNHTPVNNVPINQPMPDTGAKSSTGFIVLIALTSVSAIYTFIKVREYNI